MAKPLRVLFVEDSERDVALLVRALRQGGYDLNYRRVDTSVELTSALDGESWDIVISDYSMPRFSAPEALAIVQRNTLDLPVIIVSGTIGEEAAVSALHAGARDFMVKGAIARLIPAIERELREVAVRAERRHVSDQLEISNAMFLRAIESMSEGFAIYDRDDRLARMNSHFRALYAATVEMHEPIGMKFEDLVRLEAKHGCHLPGAESEEDFVRRRLVAHRQPEKTFIYRNIDGRWLRARDYPMPDGSIIAVRTDVSELVESKEQFRTLADNLPGVVYRQILGNDGELRDSYVSPSVGPVLGVDAEEFISGRKRLIDFVHPDDRDRMLQALKAAATNLEPLVLEIRNITDQSEEVHWWQINTTPRRLHDGTVQFDAIALDVTDRRTAEEQLRQALKMEAVGQLTGGIAHDFNNLMSVIIGNAEHLEELLESAPESTLRPLRSIIGAGDQAAALTRRLLAFARKQTLEPRVVNINEFVNEMRPLLQRSLGEHVEIDMKLDSDLWGTFVDPHQIEAALLNLAINARDAMPEGGHLVIETANATLDDQRATGYGDLRPGDYVSLSVADDGAGIPPELVSRVVEPFFTTKAVGKGTGLGLSMVHGFAKQSGGHMNIYSVVGHGTTVRLYFPRTRATAERTPASGSGQTQLPTGSETILLVEDNAALRETAVAVLSSLGYTVLEAANGQEALSFANRGVAVDLLFTDVVMPGGLSGPELVERIRKHRPALRVLYTSGYAENAIMHQGKLDESVELLQKPYRRNSLAQKVRAVLDKADS